MTLDGPDRTDTAVISKNCFWVLFWGPFSLRSRRQLCSSNCRISLLQEAKCRVLALSSGPPVLPMLSCAGGSFAHKIPSTSVEGSMGLPQWVSSDVLISGDSFWPHLVVRRPVSGGRRLYCLSSTRSLLFHRVISRLEGAHLLDRFVSGRWSHMEQLLSINLRELWAIRLGFFISNILSWGVQSQCSLTTPKLSCDIFLRYTICSSRAYGWFFPTRFGALIRAWVPSSSSWSACMWSSSGPQFLRGPRFDVCCLISFGPWLWRSCSSFLCRPLSGLRISKPFCPLWLSRVLYSPYLTFWCSPPNLWGIVVPWAHCPFFSGSPSFCIAMSSVSFWCRIGVPSVHFQT